MEDRTDTKRIKVPARCRFRAHCGHTVQTNMIVFATAGRVVCRRCHEQEESK